VGADRREERSGEAVRGGEQRLVVGVDLDQPRRGEASRLTGVEGAGRERQVLAAGDVGSRDAEPREASQGERFEDRNVGLGDEAGEDRLRRRRVGGVGEGTSEELVWQRDRAVGAGGRSVLEESEQGLREAVGYPLAVARTKAL
jgi:hypothetical protein